ncbi:MAG: DUF3667 domain-containing protein [Parvularculaceae bacterium]
MTETVCHNCGAALVGEYCHQCGQRGDEPRRVFIGLVQDFFVDTLAIDGTLARSIWLLLRKPGRLARLYLDGKRVTYTPPFRFYLFGSVFFFLALFSFIGDGWITKLNDKPGDPAKAASEITDARIADLEKVDKDAAQDMRDLKEELQAEAAARAKEQTADAAAAGKEGAEPTWDDEDYNGPEWLRPIVRRLIDANDGLKTEAGRKLFAAQVKENLPRVLLLAPVVYALILMLLYIYRRKFYVYDHFVVSLYMHAALYAYLLMALLLYQIPVVGPWLCAVPLLWGWWQPYAVFRQAYGSNWFSAFLKWAVSILIYFIVLVLIITFGFTYALWQS